MRKYSILLAGVASLALVAGAAQAQTSWGPSHTTYWNSDSTGKFEPGQFMQTQPVTMQPTTQAAPQRMFFQQPNKRVRAQMRVRQQQPAQPAKPPTDQGAQPPAERGAQPPADAKPSAPPTQGEPAKPATPK